MLGLPKPVQAHVPLIIGAGGGPKTFAWIALHADGWMTTPDERDISGKAAALRQAWAAGNRPGTPDIRVLVTAKPSPGDLAAWARPASLSSSGDYRTPRPTRSRPTSTASRAASRAEARPRLIGYRVTAARRATDPLAAPG